MHVPQLLNMLAFAPNIEIVEALLPDALINGVTSFSVDESREAFLHHFHDHRRIADLGLCDQQMEVFGHHHVSVDNEAVSKSRLLQNSQKEVTPIGGVKAGLAIVTTTGDEMQVICAVKAVQPRGHKVRVGAKETI